MRRERDKAVKKKEKLRKGITMLKVYWSLRVKLTRERFRGIQVRKYFS